MLADLDQADDAAPRRFHRSLSSVGVVILTLSVLSPGLSIFVGGGTILQQAGTGAAIAFLAGALVCYCQTALAAELGAAYPTAGYDYAAIGHAIGDWAGATTYIAGLAIFPVFLNLAGLGIAIYLRPLGIPYDPNSVAVITIVMVTGLAMLNIRTNELLTGLFLLIEFAALALVAGIGAWHIQPDAAARVLEPMHFDNGLWVAASVGVIGIGLNSACWAMGGASQALMFSEDMTRPAAIGRIILVVFLLAVVAETTPVIGTIVGARDVRAVLISDAPFEAFLRQYLPDPALKLVSLAIAIAIFNTCLASFVGCGRTVFSMGRTELFPLPISRAMTRLTRRTDAPWVALLCLGAATLLATYIPLTAKVLLLSGNVTMITIFYVWGVYRGRRRGLTGERYRTPLFPLFPALGVAIVIGQIIVLWIDAETGRKSLFVSASIYLLAFCYYQFGLKRRRGGWRLRGPDDIAAHIEPQTAAEISPPAGPRSSR
ncbi:MAG: hypothetical protein A4S16_12425 [Proteobacteria bacterium SG_bin6]|nr:MAG: hypothetical protein A4S16_12425 [Proteobacteria bacterium SG_bin6]